MKITLTNDFHNTEVVLKLSHGPLSPGQVKHARRKLCGVDGCTCSGPVGHLGAQPAIYLGGRSYAVMVDPEPNGGASLWLNRGPLAPVVH